LNATGLKNPLTLDVATIVHSSLRLGGLSSANEGDKVSYEVVQNRGKESAENLRVG
jgi:CspA family cold shock protein